MNQPTTQESAREQLQYRELEVKHLNAVNQELQDELTAAKSRIKELTMNNTYLKGFGDAEPEYAPEPTDAQIISAVREHADKVAQNAVDSFRMDLKAALIALAKYDDNNALLCVLSDSAADLLFREEI